MKTKHCLFVVASLSLAFTSCNNTMEDSSNDNSNEQNSGASFKAVEMPSTLANGDPFPTDEATIDGWLAKGSVGADGLETSPEVIGHAWGLW